MKDLCAFCSVFIEYGEYSKYFIASLRMHSMVGKLIKNWPWRQNLLHPDVIVTGLKTYTSQSVSFHPVSIFCTSASLAEESVGFVWMGFSVDRSWGCFHVLFHDIYMSVNTHICIIKHLRVLKNPESGKTRTLVYSLVHPYRQTSFANSNFATCWLINLQ